MSEDTFTHTKCTFIEQYWLIRKHIFHILISRDAIFIRAQQSSLIFCVKTSYISNNKSRIHKKNNSQTEMPYRYCRTKSKKVLNTNYLVSWSTVLMNFLSANFEFSTYARYACNGGWKFIRKIEIKIELKLESINHAVFNFVTWVCVVFCVYVCHVLRL